MDEKLIATLTESLEATKRALSGRIELRTELQKTPETPPGELDQIEAEIRALENSAMQTELAIESLTYRKQSGGTNNFGIAADQQNCDFGLPE